MAVSVGAISAQLIADTKRFRSEMKGAREELSQFQKVGQLVDRSLVKIAKVGAAAAAGFTAITGAVGLALNETAKYADEIDKMSIRTGVAREDLQELRYAFDQVGANIGVLERATINLTRRLRDNSGEATSVARAFEKLGVQIFRDDGTFRDQADLFTDLVDALAQMRNETERNALASQVFGRGVAVNLIPVLDAGGQGIAELRQEARALGGVMREDAVLASVAFGDQMLRLRTAITGVRRTIAAEFAPVATLLADWATQAAVAFGNLTQSQRDAIVRFVSLAAVVLGVVSAFGAFALAIKAVAFGFGPFVSLGQSLFSTFGMIGRAALSLVGAFRVLASFILRTLSFVVGRVLIGGLLAILGPVGLVIGAVVLLYTAWRNNWFGIRDVLTNVWNQYIKPVFDALVEWLEATFPGPMKAIRDTWQAVWNAVTSALETAWSAIRPILEAIADILETSVKFTVAAVETVWVIAWRAMLDVAQEVWAVLGPIIALVGSFLYEHIQRAIEALQPIWQAAWTAIQTAATAAWDRIQIALQAMRDFIALDLEERIEVFKNAWERAWTGIRDAVSKAWETIKQIFSNITDFFKRPLSLDISFPGAGIVSGAAQAVSRFNPIAALGRLFGRQQGGILPGFGGGDRIPALLEAGEAIVPARVVARGLGAILGWFRAHGIRAQEGGIVGRSLAALRGLSVPSAPSLESLFDVETARKLSQAWDDLLVATRFRTREEEQAADVTRELNNQVPEIRSRWQQFTEFVGREWREITEMIRNNVTPAREQLQAFVVGLLGAFHPLNLLAMLLNQLMGPVQALLVPIAMVAEVVGNALLPVFKALFPIIKIVGQAFLVGAEIFSRLWNAIIGFIAGIFEVIGSLSIFGIRLFPAAANAAKSLRQLTIDVDEIREGRRQLAQMTWEEAQAKAGLIQETQNAMESMRGVPSMFRVVSRRVQAALSPPPGVVQSFGAPNPAPVASGAGVTVNVNVNGDTFGVDDLDERIRYAAALGARSASMAQHGLVGAGG